MRFFYHITRLLLLFVAFGYSHVTVAQIPEGDIPKRKLPFHVVSNLSVNQIYDQAIRSVVWIVKSDSSAGSGVLIDKKLKLVVTNEHVMGTDEAVWVLFPVMDKNGKLIEERDFYLNKNNREARFEVLNRLGYVAVGRVVAKKQATDLAILELDGLPETALEIDHDFRHVDYQINMKDNVHILGNPGKLKLWRWTLGMFQGISVKKDGKEMLRINADTYPGNSGGPVLNGHGKLIGIVSESNLGTSTVAVPLKYVDELLQTLTPKHVVSIFNNTTFTIPFLFRAEESDPDWHSIEDWTSLKPGQIGVITFNAFPHDPIPEGYPRIIFDHVTNDEESTLKVKPLKTYQRRAGSGFKVRSKYDAYEYYFHHDPSEHKLYLIEE